MAALTSMPNIGKTMADKLQAAGVSTQEELCALGAKEAFLRLREADPGACLSSLQALEGAIAGVRWHHLPESVKEDLHAFFRALP